MNIPQYEKLLEEVQALRDELKNLSPHAQIELEERAPAFYSQLVQLTNKADWMVKNPGPMSYPEVYEKLIDNGFTYERLDAALDQRDNWGSMVHAVEYLAGLSALMAAWPEDLR